MQISPIDVNVEAGRVGSLPNGAEVTFDVALAKRDQGANGLQGCAFATSMKSYET